MHSPRGGGLVGLGLGVADLDGAGLEVGAGVGVRAGVGVELGDGVADDRCRCGRAGALAGGVCGCRPRAGATRGLTATGLDLVSGG
jgi:hypothetical protein